MLGSLDQMTKAILLRDKRGRDIIFQPCKSLALDVKNSIHSTLPYPKSIYMHAAWMGIRLTRTVQVPSALQQATGCSKVIYQAGNPSGRAGTGGGQVPH